MGKNVKVSVDDLPVVQEIGDKTYVSADSLIKRETLYQKAVEVLMEHGINVDSIDVDYEKVKNAWHWSILITNKDVVYRIENFNEEKWTVVRKQGNSTKSLLKKLEDKVPLAKALELVADALANDIKQMKTEPTGETIQPFLKMIDEEITSETTARSKTDPKEKFPEIIKADPDIPKEIKQEIEKLAESVGASSVDILKEIAENIEKGQKVKDAIELEAIYTSKLEKVYEKLNEDIASIEDRIQKEEKPVQETIRKFIADTLGQQREKTQADFTNYLKKILSSPASPEKTEKPAKRAAKKASKKAGKPSKETPKTIINWEYLLNTGKILLPSETALENAHKIIASALKAKEESIDLNDLLFEQIGLDEHFSQMKLPENKKEFLKRLDKVLSVSEIAEVDWEYLLKTGRIILPSETALENAHKAITSALKAKEESIDLNDLLFEQIGLNKSLAKLKFPENKKEFLKRLDKKLSTYVSVEEATETAVELFKESPENLKNLEETLSTWIFNVPESKQEEIKERIRARFKEVPKEKTPAEEIAKPAKKAAKKASKKVGRPAKKKEEETPKAEKPAKKEETPIPTQGDLEGDFVVIDKHGKDAPTGFLLENFKTIEKFGKAYLRGKKVIARTEIGRQYLKGSNPSRSDVDAGNAQEPNDVTNDEKQLLKAVKKLTEAWGSLPQNYSKRTETIMEEEISPLEGEVREALIRVYAKNPKDPDMEDEDWATEQSQQSGRSYADWEQLIKSGALKKGGAENRQQE